MRVSSLSSLSFICSSLLSLTLVAGTLDDAASAYRGLNYEECVEDAEDALREPGSVDERTEAFMYLGLCQAALAQSEDARDAFISMLAISPAKELPKDLSPRFTSTYLEAKGEWLGKTPMKMEIKEISKDENMQKVEVLFDDLAALGSKIAWRMAKSDTDQSELSTPLRLAEKMELRLPLGEVQIVVLDDRLGEVFARTYGEQKQKTKVAEPPLESELGNQEVPATPPEGSLEESRGWVIGAAVGGALLVGGGIVAGALLWPRSATLTPGVSIAPPL